MNRLNLIDSMTCKYPSILTGLIFTATSLLPLATPVLAQATSPLTIDRNITLTGILPVGSDAIYHVEIKNGSTSAVSNVKITDTLPSGFTYGKELLIQTSSGVTTTAGFKKPANATPTSTPITVPTWEGYNIPANGWVRIFFTAKASPTTTGTFHNAVTATVNGTNVTNNGLSSTVDDVVVKAVPPQPPLGTDTRSATAQSFTPATFCGGKPGSDGVATNITGIINTYFQPALQSVTAGSKQINIVAGAAKGAAKDIQPGDLVMIIQMQDASINSSNVIAAEVPSTTNTNTSSRIAYGSGNPLYQGSGQTSMGNTGLYEYAIAASAVSTTAGGGTLTLKNSLINSYVSSAPTTTSGQKRFQVIRVPQYTSVKVLGTLYASPWDGNVGGILAIDTYGKFDFNGQRISANSVGFRGGYGPQNGGLAAIAAIVSPTTSTSGSGKGEGTAGTPRFISTQSLTNVDPIDGRPIWSGGSLNNGAEGYPGGDSGRGAPANAGGAGNYHNAGGGGGGNGGIGGQGGLAWTNNSTYVPFDTGGRPGYLSSTSNPVPWRLIMGGGGGGGDANNSPQGVPGGAAGGIVILRAGTIVGSGQIFANGREGNRGAYQGAPDGAGGGGAGGTVLIQSRNATTANISIEANGGIGGSTERDDLSNATPHGPGGGGAGGVVLYNLPGRTPTVSVAGGSGGQTDDIQAQNPALGGKARTPHGATAGSNGIVAPFSNSEDPFNSLNNVTDCSAKLNMTNTAITPTVRQGEIAKYKIRVTNTGTIGTAENVSIENPLLPEGFVYSKTDSIVLTTGSSPATRSTTSDPVTKSTAPAWGKFTIPSGGVVEISYQVRVKNTVPIGKYDNSARTSYPDPTRDASNSNAMIENNYDGKTNTLDDINVTKGKSEMVWDLSPTVRIVRR